MIYTSFGCCYWKLRHFALLVVRRRRHCLFSTSGPPEYGSAYSIAHVCTWCRRSVRRDNRPTRSDLANTPTWIFVPLWHSPIVPNTAIIPMRLRDTNVAVEYIRINARVQKQKTSKFRVGGTRSFIHRRVPQQQNQAFFFWRTYHNDGIRKSLGMNTHNTLNTANRSIERTNGCLLVLDVARSRALITNKRCDRWWPLFLGGGVQDFWHRRASVTLLSVSNWWFVFKSLWYMATAQQQKNLGRMLDI